MVNPFNPRTVLFAKHAQHVVLIHFPIALFICAALFDWLGERSKNVALAGAAYYNLLMAALFTIPVLATGVLAWQFQLEGERLKGVLLLHLLLACVSSLLIWTVWWTHFHARRSASSLPPYRLGLELLGVAVIGLTAHLGGFLSGVNGT